jgi:large conductance mechanosensitive channel
MSVLQEFKTFAMRGNVIDMAVGVVIGGAFGKIVSSLVADIVTPPLGLLVGGTNFSNLKITLSEAVGDTPAVVIAYGKFIQTTLDFVLIAAAIFALVKAINMLKRPEPAPAPAAPPPIPDDIKLLTEIRDLLKSRS